MATTPQKTCGACGKAGHSAYKITVWGEPQKMVCETAYCKICPPPSKSVAGVPPAVILDRVSVCNAHIRQQAIALAQQASARQAAGQPMNGADDAALAWCKGNNIDLDAEHWMHRVAST